MKTTFNGNPAVTIISFYSPTNVSNTEDKDQFYSELTLLTRSIPKHNLIIIGGGMNARIGKSDAKASVYNAVTNENGRRLLDYMQECGLRALNTTYRKHKENFGHTSHRKVQNHKLTMY